ncbi:hypothetical protein M5689_013975 [Euphorbia peplus]|nr:hypothetical protein M5689_013975 [Euphorbia peplus]
MEYEEEERWFNHYSSNQRILLVGEGDFSFSATLALHFGSASNIVATSLDSYDVLIGKYKKARLNLHILLLYGACTSHGVDATNMRLHSDLMMQKFDRIVFNFPHAGFHGMEDDTSLIEKHKKLVLDFFTNASQMLEANGEIHVTHKTSFPFNRWNIVELARRNSLRLIGCVAFKIEDYPGYNNKRGDCRRCDEPFPLGKCCTFKFGSFPAYNNMSRVDNPLSELSLGYSLLDTHYPRIPFHHGYPETCLSNNMYVVLEEPLATGIAYPVNQTLEIYQVPMGSNLHGFSYGTPGFDYEGSMAEAFGKCQLYQANPSQDQYQGDLSGPWDIQGGFKFDMNNFPGYMGEPSALVYGPYSGGTQMWEYGKCAESASGRLPELNLSYQESNAAKAPGFEHYE